MASRDHDTLRIRARLLQFISSSIDRTTRQAAIDIVIRTLSRIAARVSRYIQQVLCRSRLRRDNDEYEGINRPRHQW